MELISVRSLAVDYNQVKALEEINIDINSDDFIGIIGPNGGGKTTFVKALLGLVRPSSGSVEYRAGGIKIGYLPQHKTIDASFPVTVADVVSSGMIGRKGWRKPSRNELFRVVELLNQAGIGHLHSRQIGQLSGGQLQRVLLCRAIMRSPELLILDEPTTYVDSDFNKSFYELLLRLSQQMAIIVVSHDISDIAAHVKTMAYINRKMEYGPAQEIIKRFK